MVSEIQPKTKSQISLDVPGDNPVRPPQVNTPTNELVLKFLSPTDARVLNGAIEDPKAHSLRLDGAKRVLFSLDEESRQLTQRLKLLEAVIERLTSRDKPVPSRLIKELVNCSAKLSALITTYQETARKGNLNFTKFSRDVVLSPHQNAHTEQPTAEEMELLESVERKLASIPDRETS